jgi:DNA-binding transcriptional MerR regulator
VGVSQRCLDYWAERGIVTPSIQPAAGKGSERRYAFDDLVKLALVKRLREAGLSLQKIRKGLEQLRKRWPKKDPLLDEMLATDGSSFFRIRGDQVEDVLASGQLLLSVVAVGRIRQDVQESVLDISTVEVPGRGRPAGVGGQGRLAESGK